MMWLLISVLCVLSISCFAVACTLVWLQRKEDARTIARRLLTPEDGARMQ